MKQQIMHEEGKLLHQLTHLYRLYIIVLLESPVAYGNMIMFQTVGVPLGGFFFDSLVKHCALSVIYVYCHYILYSVIVSYLIHQFNLVLICVHMILRLHPIFVVFLVAKLVLDNAF